MSSRLVSHSADLLHLVDDGYEVEIRSNYLLVNHVPYVNADRVVAYGSLVSELSQDGTSTIKPSSHEVWFIGALPCDNHGQELTSITNQRTEMHVADGIVAGCSFSSKPTDGQGGFLPEGYADYYDKMTSYSNILCGFAQAIDPGATALTHAPVVTTEDESVFRYLDAWSSRARISAVSEKLAVGKVAIVGLGGTGAYILDLVAKTPVPEIHLYDRDTLYAHNAFRAPGAASVDELRERPNKVDYLHSKYDAMHRNVIPHAVHVTEENVGELQDMTFVFLSMDAGPAKRLVVEALEGFGVPFVDTGMGVYEVDGTLAGLVRTTASSNEQRDHVWEQQRISFADEGADEYDRNIQIADLNALNAVLAVIKWKKLFGFYADLEREFSSVYTVDGNDLLNEDFLA